MKANFGDDHLIMVNTVLLKFSEKQIIPDLDDFLVLRKKNLGCFLKKKKKKNFIVL